MRFLLTILLITANLGAEMICLENEPTDQELIEFAIQGQKRAYAPYSNYFVGAAVYVNDDGNHYVFPGCNVENASYGLTICGERTAVTSAVASGFQKGFEKIAIVTKDGLASPCGACRQFMNEFNPKMKIILASEKGEILIPSVTLDELLPNSFGPHNLH